MKGLPKDSTLLVSAVPNIPSDLRLKSEASQVNERSKASHPGFWQEWREVGERGGSIPVQGDLKADSKSHFSRVRGGPSSSPHPIAIV